MRCNVEARGVLNEDECICPPGGQRRSSLLGRSLGRIPRLCPLLLRGRALLGDGGRQVRTLEFLVIRNQVVAQARLEVCQRSDERRGRSQ